MQGKTIDVFISYSSKDKSVADAICNRLESGNLRCWYAPRDIVPGADWASSIVQAIKHSRVFLLVYSENSNQSRQVFNELTTAFNSECVIIPFRLDESDMSGNMAYYLNAVHWLDALTPPLEKHIEHLYRYVLSVMQGTPPPSPPPPDERRASKIIKYIALALACVLTVAVGMFGTMFLLDALDGAGKKDKTGPADPQNSVSQATDGSDELPLEPLGVQDIKMQQLHQAGDYGYPGYAISMLDTKSELFFMVKEGNDGLYLLNLRTGKILLSGIEHDFKDLEQVSVITTPEYDTMYFVDEADDRISIFNRKTGKWINREGVPLALSDTEYYYLDSYDEHSFRSKNEEMENVCLFIYDYQLECFSQLIWVTPDGIRDVLDIRNLELTDIVNGFKKDVGLEYQVLMLDRHLNLVILDIMDGRLLNISFDTILNEYIPKLADGGVILSPDGRFLLQHDSSNAKVWDLQTDKLVFNRDFTNEFTVEFGADNEIVYYCWSDNALHIYDLLSQKDTVQLDEAFFLEHSEDFLGIPGYTFDYLHEYDLYAWLTYRDRSDDGMDVLLTITDRDGNIYAKSDDMMIPDDNYYVVVTKSEGYLLVAGIATQNAPDDVPGTILYRAICSEDAAGRLVFADVYYYDE